MASREIDFHIVRHAIGDAFCGSIAGSRGHIAKAFSSEVDTGFA